MRRYISLLLFIGLAFWGCEEDAEPDTTALENNNTIELEFVIVKNMISGVSSSFAEDSHTTDDTCDVVVDCAGECDGDAIEQTYYYDNDGDGLGGDYDRVICSAFADENWVLNSDDDDDTIPTCLYFSTIDFASEDIEYNDGTVTFSYSEEDYAIDVSECLDDDAENNLSRIIQDTELQILYLFFDGGYGFAMDYSSPNELLFAK